MNDAATTKAAIAGATVVSGAGSALATIKGWVLELLGIQLPVLLAAAAGAFGARMMLPEVPFWRALAATSFWTLAGGWCAELGRWVLGRWIDGGPPAAALSGVALIIAGFGQRFAPIVWDEGGKALERWFRSLRSGGGNG